jgi:hypothetical protein
MGFMIILNFHILNLMHYSIGRKLGVGSYPVQAPAEKVEIRTDLVQVRAKEFNFYSDREYLQYKVNVTDNQINAGMVGAFITVLLPTRKFLGE